MIKVLQKAGGDAFIEDKYGHTPFYYRTHGKRLNIRTLKDNAVSESIRNQNKITITNQIKLQLQIRIKLQSQIRITIINQNKITITNQNYNYNRKSEFTITIANQKLQLQSQIRITITNQNLNYNRKSELQL